MKSSVSLTDQPHLQHKLSPTDTKTSASVLFKRLHPAAERNAEVAEFLKLIDWSKAHFD